MECSVTFVYSNDQIMKYSVSFVYSNDQIMRWSVVDFHFGEMIAQKQDGSTMIIEGPRRPPPPI